MRKMFLFFPWLAGAVVVLAAGCATSPQTRYFALAPEAPEAAAKSEQAVVVGPFQLAEYLQRPQIVTHTDANSVAMADFFRWAEPLDAGFQRVVTTNLGRLLGSDRVLEFPAQGIAKVDRRLTGRISRFDANATGMAVLEVQWGILDAGGEPMTPGHRTRYEVQAAGSDPAATVAALNHTVTQFSEDVAKAIR